MGTVSLNVLVYNKSYLISNPFYKLGVKLKG